MDASPSTPLAHYAAALGTLENADKPSPTTILTVLLARDQLQPNQLSAKQTLKLLQLDDRLRQCAPKLLADIPSEQWKQSLSVDETAWWWNLEPPSHPLDRFDWLWNAGTVTTLAASTSLVVDIGSKFLAVTPGLFGSFAVVGQSVLTLATAGSVLTDAGKQGIEQALASMGIRRYLWQETKLGLSLMLLTSLVGFRTSLPRISEILTDIGKEKIQAGEVIGAENQFKRAIGLDGDNAMAHYELAGVYTTLDRTESAAEQYQIAAQGGVWPAYTELAELSVEAEDPQQALELIEEALGRIPENTNTIAVREELTQIQTSIQVPIPITPEPIPYREKP